MGYSMHDALGGLRKGATIEETIAAFKKAQGAPVVPQWMADLRKVTPTFAQSGSSTTGLTYYDLEPGAKMLFPDLTPIRNETPRVPGPGGISANWRSIISINGDQNTIAVGPGQRGAVQQIVEQDNFANYKEIGLEDFVNFEADYAGTPAFDVKAIAATVLLQRVMNDEEKLLLGGNSSFAINGGSAIPTPTLADVTTGGSLLHSTQYFVVAVALAYDGYNNQSATGLALGSRTNADGTTLTYGAGYGQVSAEANITLGTGVDTRSITASLSAAQAGAVAYAWYLGTTTGQEKFVGTSVQPSFTFTALAPGGNQLASALGASDNSANQYEFDGLIYQALKAGSNAYVANVGGTLTADGATGISQIETAIKNRWDNFRLTPDTMWVNSQQALDISTKIQTGTSTSAQRIVFSSEQGMIAGGVMARSYLNRYSMSGVQTIDIRVHPYMPPGMILMTSKRLPYKLSGVGNVFQVRTRKEYFQTEWPLVTRQYQYGVYASQCLQHYFPPSMALLYNITAG